MFPIGNRLNRSNQIKLNEVINFTQLLGQPDDYIEQKNFIERLYDAVSGANILIGINRVREYLNPEDLAKSGQPFKNDTLCGEQLDWILTKLDENPDYIALRGKLGFELTSLFDAFGYQESGFLTESSNTWVGSAERCSRVSLDYGRIKTHHCFGNFRFNSWTQPDVHHLQTELRIGLCVPRTCDTLSFANHKTKLERLGKHHLSDTLRRNLYLNSLFCIPDQESPIRQISTGGRVYLYIIGFWLAIIVSSTIITELNFGYMTNLLGNKGSSLLESFSLRKSVRTLKLPAPYRDENIRVDLRILDFIRIVMAILIIQLHSGLLCGLLSTRLLPIATIMKSDLVVFVLSFGLFIDTFLAIFGMLISYKLLCRFKPSHIVKPAIWIGVNLHIALRISPIFILVYWFNSLIMPHIGSGPLWDYAIDNSTMIGNCQNAAWWQSIPLTSTVGLPAPACNPPGWFLGAYSQIALLMPLVIYLIASYKYEISRISLIVFIAIISSINNGFKMSRQDVVPMDVITKYGSYLVVIIEKYENSGYMDTLSRFGTVAIGALLGYYLYRYEVGHIDKVPKWISSRTTNIILLLSHLIVFSLPLLGNSISGEKRPKLSAIQFGVLNGLFMFIWPTINCMLLFNVATTIRNNSMLKFMNHPFWHAFNKLGLTLYLIHMGVISYIITFDERLQPTTTYGDMWRTCLQVTFVSLVLALLIYILFEAPLMHLFTYLFTPSPDSDKEEYKSGPNKGKTIESSEAQRLKPSNSDIQQHVV